MDFQGSYPQLQTVRLTTNSQVYCRFSFGKDVRSIRQSGSHLIEDYMLVGQPNLNLIRASKCWSFVHAARSFNLEICTTTSWPRLRQCTWYWSPLCRESRHPPESKSGAIDADNPIFISLKELTSFILTKDSLVNRLKKVITNSFWSWKFWKKQPVLALSFSLDYRMMYRVKFSVTQKPIEVAEKMWFSAKS